MNETKNISEILSKTDVLMEKLDDMPLETAIETYDILENAAKEFNSVIETTDTEKRVEICKRLDDVMERIVDFELSYSLEQHLVCTPAIHNFRCWGNAELMKDKGLVGYTLAKEIGMRSVMYFGTKPQDYPYLANFPEMMMYYDNTENRKQAYYDHLLNLYHLMGTLVLHGMHNQTVGYLNVYRKLRPDGKVFCGLDMNTYWMSQIQWDKEEVKQFANQCDITATSCRSLRDTLNRNPNINFPCRWFPNGFYNPNGINMPLVGGVKENIILTVGRIGTDVKNNAELMIAFAHVAHVLPNWTVRLVGAIDPGFQEIIDLYFEKCPHLKERVIFTGEITDKKELYKEYAKAKIFAITSLSEGGTPNVYAEALFHGCMFITSSIDAADDITNYGELGLKYPIMDNKALQDALVKVCAATQEPNYKLYNKKALAYAAKYYDWNRNAKKLAFMLYRERLNLTK